LLDLKTLLTRTSNRWWVQANPSYISSLPCLGLGYTFTRGEYARNRLKPKEEGGKRTNEYVVFVHAFHWEDPVASKNYRLFVTKYSFLKSSTLVETSTREAEDINSFSSQELLLHFGDFGSMGEKQDAEIINISDIAAAQDLRMNPNSSADVVEYIGPCSPGTNRSTRNLFCWFLRLTASSRYFHV
jgi:hypothetical protein